MRSYSITTDTTLFYNGFHDLLDPIASTSCRSLRFRVKKWCRERKAVKEVKKHEKELAMKHFELEDEGSDKIKQDYEYRKKHWRVAATVRKVLHIWNIALKVMGFTALSGAQTHFGLARIFSFSAFRSRPKAYVSNLNIKMTPWSFCAL